MDEKVVKKTQDSLGKIITKPPLTPKLLSKPPFRFLHDIVTEVIKTTSFFKGLYGQAENDSKKLVNREDKMSYLQKAIDVVSIVSGTNISIKTSKIVAGAEPEKTNEFLQLLARCIRKNKSSEDAVLQVLSGKKIQKDNLKSKSSSEKKILELKKAKIKDDETSKIKDQKVQEEKNEKGQDRSVEDKDQRRKIEKEKKRRERSENSIKTEGQNTERKKKKDHKNRKENKDKIRHKDEKNKLPDNKENSQHREIENKSFKTEETIDIKKHKEEKYKDNERERSKHNEDREKIKTSDEKEKIREKRRQERKKRKQLETEKRVENLEVEKTDEKVQKKTEENLVPTRYLRPSSAKGQRRRPHTKNGSGNFQSEASTELDSKQVIVNSRKIVRPPSARPSAPRVRNKQQVADEKNIESFKDKEATIIVDRDHSMTLSDNEDAEFVVQEDEMAAIENDFLQPSFIARDKGDLNSEEHGGLVRKILETKNELEGKEIVKQSHTHIHQNSLLNAQKEKEQELVVKEIDILKDMVQKLCQTSAPLAKLIDYSQEDTDSMANELNTWKTENLQHNVQIKEDNSVTKASIEPLKAKLEELDQAIADYRLKMSTTKVNILKNDEKIQKMAIAVATRS